MTLSEYLSLVPMWNAGRPRFMNTVATLLQPLVDAQDMLAKLTADFDLDTAVGVQLDAVGQWIGRTRYILLPIHGVYFSFDLPAENVGFDKGIWFGPYDTPDGVQRLDDDTFRMVLKLQAIANHWDGTVPSLADELDRVFPGISIVDMGDTPAGLMTMDVLIPTNLISTLLLSILEQDFPIKPSGVLVNFIETTLPGTPIFAFDVDYVEGGPLAGFGPFGPNDMYASWGLVVLTV
jgi:hypothetical protein